MTAHALMEALFVETCKGNEYIVVPSGSYTHHVLENLDAITQTDEVREVRLRVLHCRLAGVFVVLAVMLTGLVVGYFVRRLTFDAVQIIVILGSIGAPPD